MKKQFDLALKSLAMALILMGITVIYGAIAHPNDPAIIYTDRGWFIGLGAIIANTVRNCDT
jgi:hypothetical protein